MTQELAHGHRTGTRVRVVCATRGIVSVLQLTGRYDLLETETVAG